MKTKTKKAFLGIVTACAIALLPVIASATTSAIYSYNASLNTAIASGVSGDYEASFALGPYYNIGPATTLNGLITLKNNGGVDVAYAPYFRIAYNQVNEVSLNNIYMAGGSDLSSAITEVKTYSGNIVTSSIKVGLLTTKDLRSGKTAKIWTDWTYKGGSETLWAAHATLPGIDYTHHWSAGFRSPILNNPDVEIPEVWGAYGIRLYDHNPYALLKKSGESTELPPPSTNVQPEADFNEAKRIFSEIREGKREPMHYTISVYKDNEHIGDFDSVDFNKNKDAIEEKYGLNPKKESSVSD